MPPLTAGVDDTANGWPFMPPYNPLTYPPLPQPQPPRPTMQRRLAASGVRWLTKTASYMCAAWAVYILATGQI